MSPDKLNRVVSASTVTIILSQIISTQVVFGSNPLKKDKSKDPLFWSYKYACSSSSKESWLGMEYLESDCEMMVPLR